MSFSSTSSSSSSKESSAVTNPDRNGSESGREKVYSKKTFFIDSIFIVVNVSDNETKPSTTSIDNDSPITSISKAERDQEMQKYYRADLIQHLTEWRSTQ
jgi:hypothetical protein